MSYGRSNDSNALSAMILIICIIGFCTLFTVRIVKAVHFTQNCEGFLDRAANSGTVENAVSQLKIALDYIEKEKLTEGYTSVLYRTPDEDMGFWYKNLKDTYDSLVALPESSSELERSNALMKLREVLVTHGEKGSSLIIPEGITIYPANGVFMFFLWMFFIVGSIALIVTGSEYI